MPKIDDLEKETQKEIEVKNLPFLSFNTLKKRFNEVFLIKDPGIIKLVFAAVIANRIKTDPVWLFIVGAPGSGKTEFITALSLVNEIYPISSLTAHTFISGKKGQNFSQNSLLLKIQSGTITLKDFTTLLSINKDERKEIMSQFREIYDGSFDKPFGTGEEIHWKGKIGLIAGVTTVIYQMRDLYAAMGERFIMYYPELPDRKEMARRAMQNVESIQEKRLELQKLAQRYLDKTVKIHNPLPVLSPELNEELLELAEFSTRARSPVDREIFGSNKEITFAHPPELPTRFASQLKILALGLAMINENNEVMEEDKQILYNIALSSITITRRKALHELTKYASVNTSGLATKLNYPTSTVRRWLEDLNALEMVIRLKSGNKDLWQIKEEYRPILQKYENITLINAELTEEYLQGENGNEQSTSSTRDPEPSEYASEESSAESYNALPLDDSYTPEEE